VEILPEMWLWSMKSQLNFRNHPYPECGFGLPIRTSDLNRSGLGEGRRTTKAFALLDIRWPTGDVHVQITQKLNSSYRHFSQGLLSYSAVRKADHFYGSL